MPEFSEVAKAYGLLGLKINKFGELIQVLENHEKQDFLNLKFNSKSEFFILVFNRSIILI